MRGVFLRFFCMGFRSGYRTSPGYPRKTEDESHLPERVFQRAGARWKDLVEKRRLGSSKGPGTHHRPHARRENSGIGADDGTLPAPIYGEETRRTLDWKPPKS